MWQSLLRNYLLGQMRQAATQAAQNTMDQRRGATAADNFAAGGFDPSEAPQTTAPGEPPQYEPTQHERPVCHVGLVFALSIESGGLMDLLRGVITTEGQGFVAREGGLDGRRLVVIQSGAGRQSAARATEALIQGHAPRWIISAGFAGGLDPRLQLGDILMAEQVVDVDGRRLDIDFKLDRAAVEAQPHLHVGRLVTGDHILHTREEKLAAGERFGALAVDMETSAVAEACRREKVRFLAVRVISDKLDREIPRDIDRLLKSKSTAGRLGAAAGALVRRPGSIKDMWQLKEDALVASDRLGRFLRGVIGQLS